MKDVLVTLGIACVAVILLGLEYASRNLWEPDEARYAYIAREMALTGRGFVVTRHNEPYSDKPPLMFWLINGFSAFNKARITGVTARLPSLAGVLLSLWTTYLLMNRWTTRSSALISVFVLATSFLFWQTGGMGQLDALLCGLEMVALCFLYLDSEKPKWHRPITAYFAMGLGMLQKGPVGFVVPAGMHITACLATGEQDKLKRWHWLWGTMLSLALPAVWLLLAWREGAESDYLKDLLFGQVSRRVTAGTGHNKSVFYFVHQFPLSFLPWTLVLPASFAAVARQQELKTYMRRLLAWAGFVLVFFSIPTDKRNLYILAAFPPCAMIIGLASGCMVNLAGSWQKTTAVVMSFLVTLVGITSFFVAMPYFNLSIRLSSVAPVAITMCSGAAMSLIIFRRHGLSYSWFACWAMTLIVSQLFIAGLVYRDLNPLKTPWELARASREMGFMKSPILLYKINGEILAFYAERQGKRMYDVESLQIEVQRLRHGLIGLEERHWPEVSTLNGALIPHRFRMGNKRMMWVEFVAGEESIKADFRSHEQVEEAEGDYDGE